MFRMPVKIKNMFINEKGMTLLEVLVALVLLSLLASTVLAIFTPTTIWIKKARDETIASNYAFAILEDLRAHREKLNGVIDPDDLMAEKPVDMEADIVGESEIDGFSNLYKITVTVTRTGDAPGNPPLAEMVTIIRKE